MLHTRIFQFNPLGTNCMVTWADGSRTCTVVDPGMSSDEGEKELLGFLASEGITPDAILLTHGHFDHVWGVERLVESMGWEKEEILVIGDDRNDLPMIRHFHGFTVDTAQPFMKEAAAKVYGSVGQMLEENI